MSAIRTSQSRGAERNKRSSPYAFALVAKIGRYFGLGSWDEPRAEDSTRKSPPPANAASSRPVRRHHLSTSRSEPLGQPSDNLPRNDVPDDIFTTSHDRPPLTPVRNSNAPTSNCYPTTSDVDGAASYLSRHIGQPVSPAELRGFLNTLSKTPQCQEERFRFSSANSSRESPPRSHDISPSATPRKTLSRNPNGVYRWEGAGSAKNARRRNRYASPVFGASPSKPDRVIMKESASLTEPDGKRRRLDETTTAPASQRASPPKAVPFPSNGLPATPRANGIANKPSAPPSARLRTPAKPTAPVKPSPLRQAWSDASSTSSHNDRQSPSHSMKQSKTADFMAELIKETTPPKKPDLSNPYQTASPVGKVGPPRRATKRARATGRPAAPAAAPAQDEQEKNNNKEPADAAKPSLKDISPQAVIEATVPKGSKRSRPPANLGTAGSSSTSSRTSPPAQREAPVVVTTKEITCMIEEPDEEEEQGARRAAKKAKPTLNGLGPAPAAQTAAPQPEIIIEEIEDVVMTRSEKGKEKAKEQLTPLIPAANASSSGSVASPTPRSSFSGFKSIPKEPSKLRYSIQLDRGSPLPSAHSAATPSTTSVDAILPVSPTTADFKTTPPSSDFTFTAPKTSLGTNKVETKESKQETSERKEAGSGSSLHENAKLKALDVDVAYLPTFVFISAMAPALSSSPLHVEARKNAQALPEASLPTYNFASGTVTDERSVPDAGTSSVSPPTWGAKLSTPSSSSTLPPATPSKGFDFAAAGMKPPPISIDTWTCSLCAIKNPTSAGICEACETPNPSTSNTTAPTSVPTPAPANSAPVQGFNWAAAGMKVPTVSQDKWTCSLCGLINPKSANQCETCETPK